MSMCLCYTPYSMSHRFSAFLRLVLLSNAHASFTDSPLDLPGLTCMGVYEEENRTVDPRSTNVRRAQRRDEESRWRRQVARAHARDGTDSSSDSSSAEARSDDQTRRGSRRVFVRLAHLLARQQSRLEQIHANCIAQLHRGRAPTCSPSRRPDAPLLSQSGHEFCHCVCQWGGQHDQDERSLNAALHRNASATTTAFSLAGENRFADDSWCFAFEIRGQRFYLCTSS